MKPKQPSDAKSERRLDRAAKHVTNLWFPINPTTLAAVRKGFEDGVFDREPDALIDTLKKDFALFTFIVKKLTPIASSQMVPPGIIHNPIELIRWGGPSRIREIISDDSLLPSSHVFNSLEPFQADRLRETAIVASTAEVLSEHTNLDPNTAYGRGVIREIGLNLIAWNYPTMYARVLKNLSPSASLDEELTKELGFSPALLAMKIIHPHLQEDTEDARVINQTLSTYDHLCDIGEALARAEHPDTYPSAENDWKLANDYLRKTVGTNAIKLIKERAIEHSKEYRQALRQSFEPLLEFNPEQRLMKHKKQRSALKNRYLHQCPPDIQAALRNLYGQMSGADSPKEALEQLLKTIIPQAGYSGGCVFVVDPATFALMPRAVFGEVKLRPIGSIALRNSGERAIDREWTEASARTSSVSTDGAATALSCNHPVIENYTGEGELGLTGMYGRLGEARKVGVLYLESPTSSDTVHETRPLGVFKALQQALCDALRID